MSTYIGFETKIVNNFNSKRPYGFVSIWADTKKDSGVVRYFATEKARDKAAKYERDNYGYR